jgi:adenine-specific DNA-methyltransferase
MSPSKLADVVQQVQRLTVIDPACGTGIFLVAALKEFHSFYQQLLLSAEEKMQGLQHVLQHQLFGIDIDPVSVHVTQLRLAHWFFELTGEQLPVPPQQIFTGNTLLLQQESRRWAFVVGNPPYVSEVRGQAERFRDFKEDGPYYKPKMDLCDAFLAWSLHHLQPDGQMAYVLPEYWTQRSSTRALRKQLVEDGKIREFWRFAQKGVFKDAPGHHTSLLIWQKQKTPSRDINERQTMAFGQINSMEPLTPELLQPAVYQWDESSGRLLFGDAGTLTILERLAQHPPMLCPNEIQQGLIMPQGRLDLKIQAKAQLETPGVFLLTDMEIERLQLNDCEQALLRPFFLPGNFQPFHGFPHSTPDYWLIYINRAQRKELERQPETFPNLVRHLSACAKVNTSAQAPYGLHRSRQPIWFEDPLKVLSARQVLQPSFAVVPQTAYVGEGFYSIRSQILKPHVLVAILNSDLAHFWFYQQKRKGERLQIDKDVLCSFPQPPVFTPLVTDELEQLGNMVQSCPVREQNQVLCRHINHLVFQLYGVSPEEISRIQLQIDACK